MESRGTNIFRQTLERVNSSGVRLREKDIADALHVSTTTISQIFQGRKPCPERHAREMADLFFTNEAEKLAFLDQVSRHNEEVRKRNRQLTLDSGPTPIRLRILSYGHLKEEELLQPVPPLGNLGLSGPTGFLVDCFTRMIRFTGREDLVSTPERVGLRTILSSTPEEGDVVLSHLAALNMINTSHFFCTPISIGIGGLLYLEGILPKKRVAIVRDTRRSFFESPDSIARKLQPICMKDEIGHYFIRTMPGYADPLTSIEDLTVEECCKALRGTAKQFQDRKVPVLLTDELTCYLTLRRKGMDKNSALLFDATSAVPRFYFGFSVPRSNREIRKELDRGSELYLQSDARYIAERYLSMYLDLVEFAKRLMEFSGPSWLARKPRVWAKLVCGISPAVMPSSLISPAWVPILDHVRKAIR